MGQIANQMLIEAILKLKERVRDKKEEKKKSKNVEKSKGDL